MVLVQPFVHTELGGVLFGVDPVSGRSDRIVVAAAADPEQVVSGRVDGIRNELDFEGRRTDDGSDETLPAQVRQDLAELAASTAAVFGGPQDMEWLLDENGELRLLQSRPVTTEIRGVPRGPLYGPGPVAETFPDPLRPLERDLWVPPLREAMREALVLAGAACASSSNAGSWSRRRTRRGRPRDHWRGGPEKRRFWHVLDIRPGLSNVRSAWRVGRLRSALPILPWT